MPPSDTLDDRLLAAHRDGDRMALIRLYTEAGNRATAEQRHEAAGFYLTHAYVYALETGAAAAKELHARLKAAGREE